MQDDWKREEAFALLGKQDENSLDRVVAESWTCNTCRWLDIES